MRIGVLGSVEVYDLDGAVLPLRRAKTRALLVVLVIHLNRRVSRDALLEALWGETPPAGAEDTLQSYVSQLRRALSLPEAKEPAAQLRTRSGAYVLEVDPELVDACCFERLAAEGAGALRAGDATGAEAVLSRALALWRGQAYAEFADQPFAQAASERLEEIRLTALEDHFDAALALGCHGQVVAELETLTAGHILRERLSAQLMLALYRSGRQADALEAYRRLRLRLAEELGIDPSPELRELERAILQQSPELAWSGPWPTRMAESPHGGAVRVEDQPAAAGEVAVPTRPLLPAPETRFAKSGDIHIAYQVVGDGPVDLVFVPGILNHLDRLWEEGTEAQRFFARLASFARLILFDKRGTGLSDRDVGRPTLEQRMDDLRAVMDAAGSERAAVLGYSEGGPMSILFATTYPERVSALVLAATGARFLPGPDYPCGERTKGFVERLDRLVTEGGWGQGRTIEWFAPNLAHSEAARANVARWERLAISPGTLSTYLALISVIDVRPLLSAVQVPTLVVQRSADLILEPCHARYLAEHIAGARLLELPGGNHILWSDAGLLADEIEDFLGGAKADADIDRVLTTVLFTDIVQSTERAGALGDHRWRQLLDRHDDTARRAISRYRGRLVKMTGDGLLATFDGPGRAVRCACTIQDEVKDLGLDIRAGIHTGEVERRGDDVSGIAVHIGQRIASLAAPRQVLVSGTVYDLVFGSEIQFEAKGARTLRGVPGRWRLFAVLS